MGILYELSMMQDKLDRTITNNHNLHTEDLYTLKKISLLVELGELANELRFFKFWSWNQERKEYPCEYCGGTGENAPFGGPCYDCEGSGYGPDKVLEEYTDIVHFTLSICLNHHKYTDKYQLKYMLDNIEPLHYTTLEEQFNHMFGEISNNMYSNIEYIVRLVIGLGKLLGYNLEDISKGYHNKFEINMQRQKEQY